MNESQETTHEYPGESPVGTSNLRSTAERLRAMLRENAAVIHRRIDCLASYERALLKDRVKAPSAVLLHRGQLPGAGEQLFGAAALMV